MFKDQSLQTCVQLDRVDRHMKGASSLSLFKHKAGSIGPETEEVTWMKMDRSSDNGKAQARGSRGWS